MTPQDRHRLILTWARARVCGVPGDSEFDSIWFAEASPGSVRWNVRYTFDHDGFSQYDKSVGYEGWVEIVDGAIVGGELVEVHHGVAAP